MHGYSALTVVQGSESHIAIGGHHLETVLKLRQNIPGIRGCVSVLLRRVTGRKHFTRCAFCWTMVLMSGARKAVSRV